MEEVQPVEQAADEAQVQPVPEVTPEAFAKLEAEKKVLEKRYSDSSREGKKNWEEKVRLEAQLEAFKRQQQESSLKQATDANQFPQKTQVVKHLVETGEFTEKQAEHLYERDRVFWQQQTQLLQQQQVLQNLIKFQRDQTDRGFTALDPLAKQATEHFEGIPELEVLPIADKVDRYKKIMEKSGQKISGRDLSEVKSAAGGSPGGATVPRGTVPETSVEEQNAKEMGWPVGAYREFSKVTTQPEAEAWSKKWKLKF